MTRIQSILAAGLVMGVCACADGSFNPYVGGDPGPVGASGELGKGTFFYQCTDDADPVCDGGQSDFPRGTALAVGASFSLYFREATGPSASLESSAPHRLSVAGSVFVAERPGTVAVIAKREGRVLDLLHLGLAEMTELHIASEMPEVAVLDEADTLALEVGQRVRLRATPRDALGAELGGALSMEWQSGDLSVVSFDGSSRDNGVELVANKPGTATIFVTMGELSRTLTAVVDGVAVPLSGRPSVMPSYDIHEIPQEEGQ